LIGELSGWAIVELLPPRGVGDGSASLLQFLISPINYYPITQSLNSQWQSPDYASAQLLNAQLLVA
jgi:hypothetical protein